MPIASQVEKEKRRLRVIPTTPVWTPKPTKVVYLERNSRPFVNFTNKEPRLLVENNGRTLRVFSFVNDGSLARTIPMAFCTSKQHRDSEYYSRPLLSAFSMLLTVGNIKFRIGVACRNEFASSIRVTESYAVSMSHEFEMLLFSKSRMNKTRMACNC